MKMKSETEDKSATEEQQGAVLITDDEKSIRNSLREILEFEGYAVLEASSGKDTLDILQDHAVDLLLLDIKMEGMDGMEVLKRVKEENHNFPVIMLTGHGNIDIAEIGRAHV